MVSVDKSIIDRRLEELIVSSLDAQHHNFTLPQSSHITAYLDNLARQASASSKGGKRLRALTLVEIAHLFASGEHPISPQITRQIIDLGCAIEVFQTAALVHDDIIDNADMRRGALSAHKALAIYSSRISSMSEDSTTLPEQALSQGNAMALMLGDLLATLSIRLAYTSSNELPFTREIFQAFLDMHAQVEIGQVMDVSMETLDCNDTEQLEKSALDTYINKTASYTTIAPLLIGVLASGRDDVFPTAQRIAYEAGTPMGIAFQIHDDILDITASSRVTGKPIGGDIREGKRTVILCEALSRTTNSQRQRLLDIYSPDYTCTDDDIAYVMDVFNSSGAIDACHMRIQSLWTSCETVLREECNALGMSNKQTNRIVTLCHRFID